MGLLCSKINLTSSDYLGPGGKSITGAFLANIGEMHSAFVFGKEDVNKQADISGIQCSERETNDVSWKLNDVYINKRRRRTLQRLSSSAQMTPIEV